MSNAMRPENWNKIWNITVWLKSLHNVFDASELIRGKKYILDILLEIWLKREICRI